MFGGVDLGKNPTKETIGKFTAEGFKENWIVGYDYKSKEPIEFESKEIRTAKAKDAKFMMCSLYAQQLADCMVKWKFNEIDEIARKEITSWEKNGGYCIYLSVLLWCLLYETGVFKEEQIKLVQGYYKHPTHGILGAFTENPADQVGLHAWIHAEGSIIDFSIVQEECCFEFEDAPYIMGIIPKNMQLIGWEEGKGTVKNYARQIAKESGMTYYEWIKYHKSNAAEVASKALHNFSEDLKKKRDEMKQEMKRIERGR